jgi:hypothetical protein
MDTQYNSKCFIFEKNTFSVGILDSCVDATYIIHLKDNGRLDHILEQLKEYRPTSTVYIAHNKGFKKCDKKLEITLTTFLLIRIIFFLRL